MRTKTNVVHKDVFNLASNLFGIETPSQTETKEKAATAAFVAADSDPGTLAIYPAIIEEAYSATLENYRRFVAVKNFQVSEQNQAVVDFNRIVRIFKKENKNNLTEVQLQMSKQFPKSYKSLNPTDYNEKVDEFVKQYGMIVQKRKMHTIKPTAELVFQNMLFIYNQQLMTKNKRYMGCGIITKTPIEAFKVNAWKLTQLTRNGVKSLDLCRKTILNHRKRFEEFGIFEEYHFAGSNRAVEVRINPSILVIKDIFNERLITSENQAVTPDSGKIVPNDNEKLLEPYKKELQMNEKVENHSQDKEFPPVTPFNLLLTGTPAGNAQSKPGGGEKNVKVSQTPSEFALSTIIPDRDLALAMTNFEYIDYKPLDIRFLDKLAYGGTLTREEFYDVAMIDFFKSLQKNIYKKRLDNPYFGSWYNAIKLFRSQRWRLFTGDCFNPPHIVGEIHQYRWRIQWARNWYAKNPTVNPLFPHQYLDVYRKNSSEIGFEYTKIKWKQQQDSMAKYDALVKKQESEAKRRGEMINHNKKMQTQLNRFLKDRITMQQLFDYVEKNLPTEFREKLPDIIQTKLLAMNEKTFTVKYSPGEFD